MLRHGIEFSTDIIISLNLLTTLSDRHLVRTCLSNGPVTEIQKLLNNGLIKKDFDGKLLNVQFQYHTSEQGYNSDNVLSYIAPLILDLMGCKAFYIIPQHKYSLR